MIASIEHNGETFEVDLLAPIDISIEMQPSPESVSAWYLDPLTIEPVKGDGFVGAVNQGGSVNFRNIAFISIASICKNNLFVWIHVLNFY